MSAAVGGQRICVAWTRLSLLLLPDAVFQECLHGGHPRVLAGLGVEGQGVLAAALPPPPKANRTAVPPHPGPLRSCLHLRAGLVLFVLFLMSRGYEQARYPPVPQGTAGER